MIVLVFVALTALRFLGAVAGQSPVVPAATVPPPIPTKPAVVPGTIAFGLGSDGRCGVTGLVGTFQTSDEIWWSARLRRAASPSENVTIVLSRNGHVVDREVVQASEITGGAEADVVCTSKPRLAANDGPGSYLLQILDSSNIVLASGAYQVSS